MKKSVFLLLIVILLPYSAFSQKKKGKHFEFNYFALEFGFSNCINTAPDTCLNKFYADTDGKIHLYPIKGAGYTPGFNIGLQFHHDFISDKGGLITGLVVNSWGNTAKYQSFDKKITLHETNRVLSLGVPLYMKLGSQIYNQQCYFYFGTQPARNLTLRTSQKIENTANRSAEDGRKRTNLYKDGVEKLSLPIIIGVNFSIVNIRLGVQPKSFFKKDYEFNTDNGVIKPFEGQSSITFFANFGFVIPLSQWTLKRSYFLSRIF